MNVITILAGIGISVVLLVPLAIKWQIRLRRSLTGALVFGFAAGAITSVAAGVSGGLSIAEQAFLEVILILGLTISFVAYMFYRDPERVTLKQGGAIVSPADGSVIYIKEIQRGNVPLSVKKGRQFKLEELTKVDLVRDGAYLIGIGMNLLNVHVNRSPIEGRVEMIQRVNGEFLSLKRPEAVLENERFITVINGGQFRIAVIQIASRLVRRIETYLVEGQTIEAGQRIGMIKFGSQVDLVVPKLAVSKVKVRPGDEVVAGVSVLVEYEDCTDKGTADTRIIQQASAGLES